MTTRSSICNALHFPQIPHYRNVIILHFPHPKTLWETRGDSWWDHGFMCVRFVHLLIVFPPSLVSANDDLLRMETNYHLFLILAFPASPLIIATAAISRWWWWFTAFVWLSRDGHMWTIHLVQGYKRPSGSRTQDLYIYTPTFSMPPTVVYTCFFCWEKTKGLRRVI